MTDIAFHFNAPDKLSYSWRLLRKIYLSGATVAVTAEPEVLAELDTLLWSFAAAEFIPHCMAGAPPQTVAVTPIFLAAALDGTSARAVLVNLGAGVPDGFEKFDRLIEVVSLSSDDLQAGRLRWKDYAARGYRSKMYDLADRAERGAGMP